MNDLTYASRRLRKSPAFTLTAVLALAIGIGSTSTIFSLVDAALLRPLPYPDAERLVMLSEQPPHGVRNTVSGPTYRDWRDQAKSFERMAAMTGANRTLTGDALPQRVPGQQVSASFFDVVGVKPAMGRAFTAAEESQPLLLVSHSYWTNKLGRDPQILGRSITLDAEPFTVIGVMPSGFQVFGEVDLWTPLSLERNASRRNSHNLRVIGRLRRAADIDQARAEMKVIAEGIGANAPDTNRNWGVTVDPIREYLVGADLRSTSLALLGAVGFLLLLSCVNVANLLLVRGAGREREIAVRSAVGASRGRIVSQLLTESLLLAGAGGAAGLAIASLLLDSAPRLLPAGMIPPATPLHLDARIVLFAVSISLLTGILFGLAPAWTISNVSLSDALRSGGRALSQGSKVHQILAAAEIALAVILVAGAGLLLRSLLHLEGTDRGYEPGNVLTMRYYLSPKRYAKPEQAAVVTAAAIRELERLPGVLSASTSTDLPLDGWSSGEMFDIVGTPAQASTRPFAHFQSVSPHYFDSVGIHFLRGRPFNDRDNAAGEPACIINEEFAHRYFGASNPVGQLINMIDIKWRVAGVIAQVKVQSPADAHSLEIYVPDAQMPLGAGAFAIRTKGDPLAMVKGAQAAIASVDKDLPLTRIRTLDEVAAQSVARPRFRAALAGIFAVAALLLAAIGVYGVLAYAVSQRLREFGIRMALGASSGDVLALIAGDVSRIAIGGIAVGASGAILLARFLATFLFGVRPFDPVTFTAVPAILAFVAITAAALPARRAISVDPATALHDD